MRFVVHISSIAAFAAVILITNPVPVEARGMLETGRQSAVVPHTALAAPDYCAATHDVGDIALGITNFAITGRGGYRTGTEYDCFTGSPVPGCQYPLGSSIDYLFAAALWVGAVVDGDTLVSVGMDGWQNCMEFHPNRPSPDHMIYRSLHGPDSANALSEEDFISVYTDTFTSGVTGLCTDLIDNRPHQPLSIEVTDRSYAWSADEAAKIVFVELGIKNVGTYTLNDAYVGVLVDADVGSTVGQPWSDDLTGLISFGRDSNVCGTGSEEFTVACIGDNDGDLGTTYPAPSLIGLTFLHVPGGASTFSYHWWQSNGNTALDYGPRRKDLIRDFGTGGTGTPEGDRNKYFLMSSGEQDFAQIYTADIELTDPIWEYPNQTIAATVSQGNDTRFLFSVGPFTIEPDQELPLVYAWVITDSVHHVADNLQNLPDNPDAYLDNLDFSRMEQAVRAAHQLYDNPGVDTEADGYKGTFMACCIESVLVSPPSTYQCTLEDTIWTSGDGVPDWSLYTPPCCIGRSGNIDLKGIVDLSDLSGLVSYLTSGGYVLPCPAEANTNGAGIIDISDLSALVNYLTNGGYVLRPCQ